MELSKGQMNDMFKQMQELFSKVDSLTKEVKALKKELNEKEKKKEKKTKKKIFFHFLSGWGITSQIGILIISKIS